LEGQAYDRGYSFLLAWIVGTLLVCLAKLVLTWLKCRQILVGLDRLPLRDAFSRMKGISWHSFWNPGGSSLRETYKLMSLMLDSLARLEHVITKNEGESHLPEEVRMTALSAIKATFSAREEMTDAYAKVIPEHQLPNPPKSRSTSSRRTFVQALKHSVTAWSAKRGREARGMPKLLASLEKLQKQTANTAAALVASVLKFYWNEEHTPVASRDEGPESAKVPLSRALAEEFVALVYVNFLVTVLLRMRTLVLTAGGIYVLVVLSISAYPFEPNPALQTMAVALILVMGGVVGYVYAEMHRDVILSRLTSTSPGELGLDFWIKFASAAAIPVFSLLAAQFPSINQFLFSWLEPVLQAVR
jgi:hypothetical protein